ncbi:coiled-coil domain-containing protein 34-like [Drosophila bipectinata]|uniref:coiled-coil domain-containing protein 34-like n=1 Tax=Drosophila bipectinata TaxID=42026 RepID=UPI001C89A485|nr:coiled-coil domain-containing protein 34-like [Drosophila bipectinata]
MAFSGHVSVSGQLIRDEIYSGKTLNRRSTSFCGSPTAVFSPKPSPQSNASQKDLVKEEKFGSKFFVADSGKSSPLSTDSWSVTYEGFKSPESQSDLVPSLHFSSQPSSRNYLQHVNSLKGHREHDAAYENWYSAKQRQRQKQIQRLKRERDYDQQRVKERKQLAQMCYDQWLKDKARLAENQRLEKHLRTAAMQASMALSKSPIDSPFEGGTSSKVAPTKVSKPTRNVSQEEIRKVVEGWWIKKQQQQKAQREAKRQDMMFKALEEERRKQMAEVAWQKWMCNVNEKPKPVPLNQGMDSLRGTISHLYVNPQPWLGPINSPK